MTLFRAFCLAILATLAAVPATAQSTSPRLSGDDYAEILQLYFKYPIALDSGDAEGYADLFTADGSFGNRVGREALIAFVTGRTPSTVRHAPLTPLIVATAEGARGTVLNLFVDVGSIRSTCPRIRSGAGLSSCRPPRSNKSNRRRDRRAST